MATVTRAPTPPPGGLTLSCARAFGKPPRPPFGLSGWSDGDEAGLCVLLDLPASWPGSGLGDVVWVAAQLPLASSLAPGRLVVVLARGAPAREWLGRLLPKRAWVAGAVRASALLSRGYVRIGAGMDATTRGDVVWGYA